MKHITKFQLLKSGYKQYPVVFANYNESKFLSKQILKYRYSIHCIKIKKQYVMFYKKDIVDDKYNNVRKWVKVDWCNDFIHYYTGAKCKKIDDFPDKYKYEFNILCDLNKLTNTWIVTFTYFDIVFGFQVLFKDKIKMLEFIEEIINSNKYSLATYEQYKDIM